MQSPLWPLLTESGMSIFHKFEQVYKKNGITSDPYKYCINLSLYGEGRKKGLVGDGIFFSHKNIKDGYTVVRWYEKNFNGIHVVDAMILSYNYIAAYCIPFAPVEYALDFIITINTEEESKTFEVKDLTPEMVDLCLKSENVEVLIYHKFCTDYEDILQYTLDFKYDDDSLNEWYEKLNEENSK